MRNLISCLLSYICSLTTSLNYGFSDCHYFLKVDDSLGFNFPKSMFIQLCSLQKIVIVSTIVKPQLFGYAFVSWTPWLIESVSFLLGRIRHCILVNGHAILPDYIFEMVLCICISMSLIVEPLWVENGSVFFGISFFRNAVSLACLYVFRILTLYAKNRRFPAWRVSQSLLLLFVDYPRW